MCDFVETKALLAVMEHDDDEVVRLIESMLPGERQALALAARNLASYAAGRYT